MDYNENEFKAKANIKARRIWLVFALLLSANYGSDVSQGGYPSTNYIIFLILCWVPFFAGDLLLRIRGKADDRYRYALVIGYGIFYTFLICTTDSPIAFTYILPVVSLLVLYKDQKFMGDVQSPILPVSLSVSFIIWSFSVRILQRTRKIISCRLPVSCSVISAISCLSATSSNPTVP